MPLALFLAVGCWQFKIEKLFFNWAAALQCCARQLAATAEFVDISFRYLNLLFEKTNKKKMVNWMWQWVLKFLKFQILILVSDFSLNVPQTEARVWSMFATNPRGVRLSNKNAKVLVSTSVASKTDCCGSQTNAHLYVCVRVLQATLADYLSAILSICMKWQQHGWHFYIISTRTLYIYMPMYMCICQCVCASICSFSSRFRFPFFLPAFVVKFLLNFCLFSALSPLAAKMRNSCWP